MSISFKDYGIDLIGSFLHLGAIIEFSFVVKKRSCTLKVRFLDYFVDSLCVNFFHVYACSLCLKYVLYFSCLQ
jgi:hypothetical protein